MQLRCGVPLPLPLLALLAAAGGATVAAVVDLTRDLESAPDVNDSLSFETEEGGAPASTMETFQVPAMYPEGIAYDKANNRLVLGSYASPALVTVDASDPTKLLTSYTRSDYDPTKNCFGLKVPEGGDGDSVMCAQSNALAGDQGAVVHYGIPYDAASAEGVATVADSYPYPCDNVTAGTGCGLANDLVILDDGTVYATDTVKGRVIKIGEGTGTEVLSEDALLSSATSGFGANGIVYHGDGGVLIVANNGERSLVIVDATTGDAAAVELEGAGDDGTLAAGPDGLLLLPDGRLLVITNAAAYVLSQADAGGWGKARVDETISFAAQAAVGEFAATAAHGPQDGEVYVTFVRMGELLAGPAGITTDPATLGKIVVAGGEQGGEGGEDGGEGGEEGGEGGGEGGEGGEEGEGDITPEECFEKWNALGFNALNFAAYPTYFREESSVILAQAGRYTGVEEIEEYVRFISPFSPYMGRFDVPSSPRRKVKSVEGDTCVLSSVSMVRVEWNETLSPGELPWDWAGANKFLYNHAENYIVEWDVFYSLPSLDAFFNNVSNTGAIDTLVCGWMQDVCELPVNAADGSCQERLAGLPVFTDGEYVDGDSSGCRRLHAVFASANPVNHCPHISFDPMEDPNGDIKCQTSSLYSVDDFFDKEDMADFKEYCECVVGIDPDIGFRQLPKFGNATEVPLVPLPSCNVVEGGEGGEEGGEGGEEGGEGGEEGGEGGGGEEGSSGAKISTLAVIGLSTLVFVLFPR